MFAPIYTYSFKEFWFKYFGELDFSYKLIITIILLTLSQNNEDN